MRLLDYTQRRLEQSTKLFDSDVKKLRNPARHSKNCYYPNNEHEGLRYYIYSSISVIPEKIQKKIKYLVPIYATKSCRTINRYKAVSNVVRLMKSHLQEAYPPRIL